MISAYEIIVLPVARAYLCPQHDAIVNTDRCPLCDSQTVVLSRIVGQLKELHDLEEARTD